MKPFVCNIEDDLHQKIKDSKVKFGFIVVKGFEAIQGMKHRNDEMEDISQQLNRLTAVNKHLEKDVWKLQDEVSVLKKLGLTLKDLFPESAKEDSTQK